MLQRLFFDYLMNLASAGKYDVYVDTANKKIRAYGPKENSAGYRGRILFKDKKGKKEVEIQQQDNIPGFHQNLKDAFDFWNISGYQNKKHPEYLERYRRYYTRAEIGKLIDEVFFFKHLESNYYIDASKVSITDAVLKESVILSKDNFCMGKGRH